MNANTASKINKITITDATAAVNNFINNNTTGIINKVITAKISLVLSEAGNGSKSIPFEIGGSFFKL